MSSRFSTRKPSIISGPVPDRGSESACYDRKPGPNLSSSSSSSSSGMSVSSLKSRLAPAVHSAVSVAVDALLGEVVVVLNQTQQELVCKEQENQRLKVRLEVSERELKSLQECLCSAQKLIDQLQISYSGPQSVFSPSLSSMASMGSGLDRDHQGQRGVNGAGVDLGLGGGGGGGGGGGSVDESLHGFEHREDYKMCQLSIQPDGSVTNHSLEPFTPNMCSESGRADERQVGGSRFEIKEEQGPVPASSRKDSGLRGDGEDPSSHGVGDLGYGQVGGEGGSHRPYTQPLRHHRAVRDCGGGGGALQQQAGLEGQKAMVRGAGRADSVSPGRADDSAGPSAPDAVAVEPSLDRPHHCLECGKTFRLISSLKKHIRIHTGEKPYPCGVCGRRFRESGALKTHLRIHTGEKPYSCSECGNCFRHLDGLRKHRRTHTGEKPYVCAICGKRLSRLQHLKHHQLIHTGERPCCCPFCNRTFKEAAALRKHVRTHREEGGHLGMGGTNDDTDPDAMDDINNLHPAAPSPQMRFGEWAAEEEDGGGGGGGPVDCV